MHTLTYVAFVLMNFIANGQASIQRKDAKNYFLIIFLAGRFSSMIAVMRVSSTTVEAPSFFGDILNGFIITLLQEVVLKKKIDQSGFQ